MLTFYELYDSLDDEDRTPFRERMIKVCSVELPTWYSWLRRKRIAKQSQILIAMELGHPVKTLFPVV